MIQVKHGNFYNIKFKVTYEQCFNPKYAGGNGRVKPLAVHFRQFADSDKRSFKTLDEDGETLMEIIFEKLRRRGI